MSMGYRGKTTNAVRENVAVQAQAEREAMLGQMTGKVIAFDPATQTASIQPDYKPRHNGQVVDMPVLQEVPVRFPRAGGFIMTMPIKPGDKVTLRPQMRTTEEFHTGGDYRALDDTRSMALSDMEAFLDGGEPVTAPISNFNNDNLEIRSADGQFKMEMSAAGQFKMQGAQGDWYELLTQVVELLATDDLVVNSSPFGGPFGGWGGAGDGRLEHRDEYAQIAAKLRGMAL